MGVAKKHHYVPRFLLKEWTKEKLLWLYLKRDLKNSPKHASVSDVGHEKNLYTSRGGNNSVETDYFAVIDSNASLVHKKLLSISDGNLAKEDKERFAHFLNTLFLRNPEGLKELRSIGRPYQKPIEYDDAPKLVQFFSTIGEQTAMSKSYEESFNKIVESYWKVVQNNTNLSLITCDMPAEILNLSLCNTIDLPQEFAIVLPISPWKLLLISNNKSFFDTFLKKNEREVVRLININCIRRSGTQIYSTDKSILNFIEKHV